MLSFAERYWHEGMAEGEAKGKAEGKAEGIAEGVKKMATLIQSGLSLEEALRQMEEAQGSPQIN